MQYELIAADETTEEKLFRVSEITWDTDGEQIKGLPDTLDVCAYDEDHAVNVASDETGWCIEECRVEQISEDV